MMKLIIITVIISLSAVDMAKAQDLDSLQCEEYFKNLHEWLDNKVGAILWSQAPSIKKESFEILDQLCELHSLAASDLLLAEVIIDKDGRVLCTKIYTDIGNRSLRDKIKKMILSIKFVPAYVNKEPVSSFYSIVINSSKCKENKYHR